jgi:hypothetical protein
MTEQPRDDGAGEFVEGDRATRLKVLVFAGVLLLLIVLERLTAPDRGLLATDPVQALNRSVDRLFYVVLVAVPLCVGASIYLLRLAVKIIRSSQWPPPGMRMAVRTKVRRGSRAQCNAILALVLAAILIVATPALIFAWYSLSRLAPELSSLHKRVQPSPRNGAADVRR